jgi:hypothetical protein
MHLESLSLIIAITLLVSCAASPAVMTAAEPLVITPAARLSPLPPAAPEMPPSAPVITPIPPVPTHILGKGQISPEQLSAFLQNHNNLLEKTFTDEFALIYREEAAFEGVNHDVAFAQMCLETGFLFFGNLVTPDMNNFCGLGAIDEEHRGESFPDVRTGIRAQIQHLKGYATTAALNQKIVDPRYRYIRKGLSPTIDGLAGTWALDPEYADKITDILHRLYTFAFGKNL